MVKICINCCLYYFCQIIAFLRYINQKQGFLKKKPNILKQLPFFVCIKDITDFVRLLSHIDPDAADA